MQNRNSSSRQPFFSVAIAAALAMTVMVTFGALIEAVAGIETFL